MNDSINNTKTVLTISMGFLVIHILTGIPWMLWISLAIGVIGMFSDYLSKVISDFWMRLAKLLSYIIPNILLTLIFFLILFPLALLSRLFIKDKDPLKLKNKYKNTFTDVDRNYNKGYFEKMW